MTTVAVQTFVIDPIWNSDSVVDSTPVSRLSTPDATVLISSSCSTASDAPGTRCFATPSSSRCWREVLAIASDMELLLSGGVARGETRGRRGEVAERVMGPIGGALAGITLDADLTLGSDRGAHWAARVKVTALRWMVRIRRVAELEIAECGRTETRHRGEQGLRVGML